MKNSLNTIYLLLSLLVSLLMVFLDPIAAASSEAVAGVLIYLILFGAAITLIFSMMFILNKIKRNLVSASAFAITFINMAIIALVLIFGSLLS
ncbi:hypothetical protein BBI15_07800 [Planococcus plakortidis]|uniref:Histidine kinase n=1 Tax=Planococcus plakortidis TaxID=1038856 RepID=A0A1C7E9L4_9BACL|nr:hypothetical protein [Planococcus plakortidis]ANU20122.1 hypothetical protein BBI15_07800 [Planococcus plakortidis]